MYHMLVTYQSLHHGTVSYIFRPICATLEETATEWNEIHFKRDLHFKYEFLAHLIQMNKSLSGLSGAWWRADH